MHMRFFWKARRIYIALEYNHMFFIVLGYRGQIWANPQTYQKRAKHNFDNKSMKIYVSRSLFLIINKKKTYHTWVLTIKVSLKLYFGKRDNFRSTNASN